MLAIELRERKKLSKEQMEKVPEDIIVLKKDKLLVEYLEDGTKIERQTYKKVNLTKRTHETAKLVKMNLAEERLKELQNAIDKELKEIKRK